MKCLLALTVIAVSNFSILMAKDLSPFEDSYMKNLSEDFKQATFNEEVKSAYLKKTVENHQKSYEERIHFLENELQKTKEKLLEKSLSYEKLEDHLKDNFIKETFNLKKELAAKTKTLLEYQRQMEKMNPSQDLKNLIKINTELSAELRKSEDTIAIIQLKQVESMRAEKSFNRMPASLKSGK